MGSFTEYLWLRQERQRLFNIGYMIYASRTSIIAVYIPASSPSVHDDQDACYFRPPSRLFSTNIWQEG